MDKYNFGKVNKVALENNFIKALKDDDFKLLVNSLNVADEVKYRYTSTLKEVVEVINNSQNYPMFVKPSNSGSSVGVTKVENNDELSKAIDFASQFDRKVLIEEGLIGKEVECAVLGNEEVISSCVGEIRSAEEFYSFDAKYKNQESKVLIPADISKELSDKIRKLAIKAFKAIDGKGLSRVDFFANEKTGEVFINEINTLPGFTQISMYPKLFDNVGIPYNELLDRLIKLVLER